MVPKPIVKINPIQVVWETKRDAVEEELKDILGVDELVNTGLGYFQKRNTAAKRVLDNMAEQDRTELNMLIKERKAEGNPEPVRRE